MSKQSRKIFGALEESSWRKKDAQGMVELIFIKFSCKLFCQILMVIHHEDLDLFKVQGYVFYEFYHGHGIHHHEQPRFGRRFLVHFFQAPNKHRATPPRTQPTSPPLFFRDFRRSCMAEKWGLVDGPPTAPPGKLSGEVFPPGPEGPDSHPFIYGF